MDARFLFWWRWLIVATCSVLLLGAGMVVLPGPTQKAFNRVYLSSPTGAPMFPAPAVAHMEFISAVLGAVLIGWSVALLYVLCGTFRRGRREGWRAVAVSLAAWFIPDSAFSLQAGYWQNAALNVLVLGMFAVPLAATYTAMKAPEDRTAKPT